MIYKNEDDSIYKIEKVDFEVTGVEDTNYAEIVANSRSINEIIEVLNYILKEIKHLPQETVELPSPNDGEIVTKGG